VNDRVNSNEINNNEELLARFHLTYCGAFSRLIELIKGSPYLQGRNAQKQSLDYLPELLVYMEFRII
jgi:hypothetical protein